MDPLKVALSAWLADRGIKLVHVWRNGNRFNAMMETTDRHVTGVAVDMTAAVTDGLDRLGSGGLACRLYIAEYLAIMMTKEVSR